MARDQSFLKLFDAGPVHDEEDSGGVTLADPQEPVDEGGILSLEQERQIRALSHGTTERIGDDLVWFGDSTEELPPLRSPKNLRPRDTSPRHEPKPSGRFLNLYAEKPDEPNRSKPENGRFHFESQDLDSLNHPTESFSLHFSSKALSPEEAILRFDSGTIRENRPNEAESFWSRLEPTVREHRLPHWPKSCWRLLDHGGGEFSRLGEIAEKTIRRGFRILGIGAESVAAGTSSILIGLARELVRRRFAVLVLDADFSNPSLAPLLGFQASCGWEAFGRFPDHSVESGLVRVDVARSNARLRKGTVEFPTGNEAVDESFHLLPLFPRAVRQALLMTKRPEWLPKFFRLAEWFDVVLIDHGLLTTLSAEEKTSEMLWFGEDGWFLVRDLRHSEKSECADLISESARCRVPCLGIIENNG